MKEMKELIWVVLAAIATLVLVCVYVIFMGDKPKDELQTREYEGHFYVYSVSGHFVHDPDCTCGKLEFNMKGKK